MNNNHSKHTVVLVIPILNLVICSVTYLGYQYNNNNDNVLKGSDIFQVLI